MDLDVALPENILSGSFTFAAHCRTSVTSGVAAMSIESPNHPTLLIDFYLWTNQIRVHVVKAQKTGSGHEFRYLDPEKPKLEVNVWGHVAIVQDATAGKITFYFDGVPKSVPELTSAHGDGLKHPRLKLATRKHNPQRYSYVREVEVFLISSCAVDACFPS